MTDIRHYDPTQFFVRQAQERDLTDLQKAEHDFDRLTRMASDARALFDRAIAEPLLAVLQEHIRKLEPLVGAFNDQV